MPVRRVGRSIGTNRLDHLGQRVRAIAGPEPDLLGVKVDVICKVIPVAGLELDRPLRLAPCVPPQGVVFAAGATVLQLGEMAFEEGDLVLVRGARRVGGLRGQREMVVEVAGAQVGGGLGDQFGALHVLAVPGGGSILQPWLLVRSNDSSWTNIRCWSAVPWHRWRHGS